MSLIQKLYDGPGAESEAEQLATLGPRRYQALRLVRDYHNRPPDKNADPVRYAMLHVIAWIYPNLFYEGTDFVFGLYLAALAGLGEELAPERE